MPLLGSLLVTLFGSIASFLVKFLGVRLAAITAAIATYTTLTLALYAAMAAAAQGIAAAFPSLWLTGIWIMVPDNAGACLSACILADTAVALYRWNMGSLQLAAGAAR